MSKVGEGLDISFLFQSSCWEGWTFVGTLLFPAKQNPNRNPGPGFNNEVITTATNLSLGLKT